MTATSTPPPSSQSGGRPPTPTLFTQKKANQEQPPNSEDPSSFYPSQLSSQRQPSPSSVPLTRGPPIASPRRRLTTANSSLPPRIPPQSQVQKQQQQQQIQANGNKTTNNSHTMHHHQPPTRHHHHVSGYNNHSSYNHAVSPEPSAAGSEPQIASRSRQPPSSPAPRMSKEAPPQQQQQPQEAPGHGYYDHDEYALDHHNNEQQQQQPFYNEEPSDDSGDYDMLLMSGYNDDGGNNSTNIGIASSPFHRGRPSTPIVPQQQQPPQAAVAAANNRPRGSRPPATNAAFYANRGGGGVVSPDSTTQQQQQLRHNTSYSSSNNNDHMVLNNANTSYSTHNSSTMAHAAPTTSQSHDNSSNATTARHANNIHIGSSSQTSSSSFMSSTLAGGPPTPSHQQQLLQQHPLVSNFSSSTMAAVVDVDDDDDDHDVNDAFSLGSRSSSRPPPVQQQQQQQPEASPHPFASTVSPVQPSPSHSSNHNSHQSNNGPENPLRAAPPNGKKDDSWRRHGRAYRAQLVQHDELSGRHDFEMSHDCSIQRYHLVAEKVLNQFLDTRDDPDVNLRDTYLVGTRLSKFLSVVLPTHRDYHAATPELAELRRVTHARWLTLNHYLEELALIIDEEENKQFILQDLNDTLNGDDEDQPDNHITNVNTSNIHIQEDLTNNAEFPPGGPLEVSPNRSKSRSPARNNAPSPYTLPPPPNHQHPQRQQLYPSAVNHQFHHGNNSNAHQVNFSDTREYHDNTNSNANFAPGDNWNMGDAKTVTSLDTNWFSTAGFSDPFPSNGNGNTIGTASALRGVPNNGNANSDSMPPPSQFLADHEQIVQITGSRNSQRRVVDPQQIEFTNLSLDDDGSTLEYITSLGATKGNAPAAVSPSPTKGSREEPLSSSSKQGLPWKIAPFTSSSTTVRQPSPLSNDESYSYQESWSPAFGRDTNNNDSVKHRVSWMDPANDNKEQAPSPARKPIQELPKDNNWWKDSPERKGVSHKATHQNQSEGSHEKIKRRTCTSRYMYLEEHEKHSRQKASSSAAGSLHRHQQEPMAPLEQRGFDSEPLRPTRQDQEDHEDSEFAAMSAVLDGNRRRGSAAQPYRHRGMHHFKECVRCLLE